MQRKVVVAGSCDLATIKKGRLNPDAETVTKDQMTHAPAFFENISLT